MKRDIKHIKTVSEFLKTFGLEEPNNPFISILHPLAILKSKSLLEHDYILDFYTITLKDNTCSQFLGKKKFNFEEGELAFTKPNQVLNISSIDQLNTSKGWVLLFHSDLLKSTPLFNKLNDYRFFDYSINQGISLSTNEQKRVTECVNFLKNEIMLTFDKHSSVVISSILEVMLNLCNRFFERQFDKKAIEDNYIVSKIDAFLKLYYENNLFSEKGVPEVNQIATYVNLSPNYLSNILKKETGKNTKDYINYFILEKSKSLLLNKQDYSISELAFKLGFNYPHYFSRFFKSKTGKTPLEYRKQEY